MTICEKHPKYQAFRAPTADCETCRRIWAATPAQRRLRRNEYQRAYRLRPGRREADALASRKTYWKKNGPEWFRTDGVAPYDPECACGVCTKIRGFKL